VGHAGWATANVPGTARRSAPHACTTASPSSTSSQRSSSPRRTTHSEPAPKPVRTLSGVSPSGRLPCSSRLMRIPHADALSTASDSSRSECAGQAEITPSPTIVITSPPCASTWPNSSA
jgi:hypothetical protein